MLKKSIALFLSVCMLFSLCACGSDKDEKKTKKSETKAESVQEDSTGVNEGTTATTVKPEEKLSSTCSMVLCTGSENGNTYELVANQIDGYPDTTFEFGVIKNNQWLVPMGSDCPFINDQGWWVYAEGSNAPRDFEYIQAGCFYYNYRDPYDRKILYKPETGVSIEVLDLFEDSNSEYRRHPYTINDEAEIMAKCRDQEKTYLTYINMNTGETKKLPLETFGTDIGIISDGLFFAEIDDDVWNSGWDKRGFYDLNGNQVIDLSTYNIVDLKDRKFTDGKYTFTAINNSNVRFDITIDTTGKVLSQEKEQA